jgi:hypothetical protein
MRVLVHYAVNVDDDFRRAIRRYYGEDRLATRAEIVAWFQSFGESMNDDLELGEHASQ